MPTRPPNTAPFAQPAYYTTPAAVPAAVKDASGSLTVVGPAIAAYRGVASKRLDFEVTGARAVPFVFRVPRSGSLRHVSITVHTQLPVGADIIIRRSPAGQGAFAFQDMVTLSEILQKSATPAGYDVDFDAQEFRLNQSDSLAAQVEVDGAFIDAVLTLFFSLDLDAE